jgi:hypothetical protein
MRGYLAASVPRPQMIVHTPATFAPHARWTVIAYDGSSVDGQPGRAQDRVA